MTVGARQRKFNQGLFEFWQRFVQQGLFTPM